MYLIVFKGTELYLNYIYKVCNGLYVYISLKPLGILNFPN